MADAYDASTPLDTDKARFGAAELRAIKARMDAITGSNLSGLFAWRNKAVNPEFLFDQINEGVAVTASGQDVDGWTTILAGGPGVISRSRGLSGGVFYRGATVTVIDAAAAAAAQYVSRMAIEGVYCRDLLQGTAAATGFTISFDYFSSTAGLVLPISVRNAAGNRSYVTAFSVSGSGVWESKVVQIPGDTLGVWATDNTAGLIIDFDHGSGTNYRTTRDSWQAGNFTTGFGVTSQITAGMFGYIRNFQVQKGLVPNPVFEAPAYDEQLQYCQRYYEKSYGIGVALGTASFDGAAMGPTQSGALFAAQVSRDFKVSKRANPTTVSFWNPGTGAAGQMVDSAGTASAVTLHNAGPSAFFARNSGAVLAANSYAATHWAANARIL